MVTPTVNSLIFHSEPLNTFTSNVFPWIDAGPSSFPNSLRGTSRDMKGSDSNAVAFPLKARLHVTSGEETLKLFDVPSKENNMLPLLNFLFWISFIS